MRCLIELGFTYVKIFFKVTSQFYKVSTSDLIMYTKKKKEKKRKLYKPRSICCSRHMIRFLEKTKWINGSVAEQGRDKTKFSRKRKYLNKEKKMT